MNEIAGVRLSHLYSFSGSKESRENVTILKRLLFSLTIQHGTYSLFCAIEILNENRREKYRKEASSYQ